MSGLEAFAGRAFLTLLVVVHETVVTVGAVPHSQEKLWVAVTPLRPAAF